MKVSAAGLSPVGAFPELQRSLSPLRDVSPVDLYAPSVHKGLATDFGAVYGVLEAGCRQVESSKRLLLEFPRP